jgi:hypothetical protein
VAPLVEVVHRRVGFAVKFIVERDFAVVEQLGDDRGNVRSLDASGDVLTILALVLVNLPISSVSDHI